MRDKEDVEKSCDPQPFDHQLPAHNWTLDQLGEYAQHEYQSILAGERTLAPAYWRLGNGLTLARKQLGRGHWGPYLKSLGIDTTRSSKACTIFRRFPSPDSLLDLTVDEAYEARRTPSSNQEASTADAANVVNVFAKSLAKIEKVGAKALDVSPQLNPEEKRELLKQIRQMIARLQDMQRELKRNLEEDGAGAVA